MMQKVPGYDTGHGFSTVNYFIWLMIQLKLDDVSFVPILVLKCITIWIGLSLGNWGMLNPNSDLHEYPSYISGLALAKVFSHSSINFEMACHMVV